MKINYPIKKNTSNNTLSASNRGMNLETAINDSNLYYLTNNIANIHKKPTPIQIVSVSYPSRNKAKITEAYYKTPSTTDYNGIYLGKYIDFEVKETHSKTSFPLKNIHHHQIEHLKSIESFGGIGFIIVYFSLLNECFLLPLKELLLFYEKQDDRKSIPYEEFKKRGFLIKEGYPLRLDFLSIVKEYLL